MFGMYHNAESRSTSVLKLDPSLDPSGCSDRTWWISRAEPFSCSVFGPSCAGASPSSRWPDQMKPTTESEKTLVHLLLHDITENFVGIKDGTRKTVALFWKLAGIHQTINTILKLRIPRMFPPSARRSANKLRWCELWSYRADIFLRIFNQMF